MKTDEAKKYCIEVIGMIESDFRIASSDDVELDGIEKGDFLHDCTSFGECGDETEIKTAIELATEHKWHSDPKNQEKMNNWIDKQLAEKL